MTPLVLPEIIKPTMTTLNDYYTSTISTKGQAVFPRPVREALGLKPQTVIWMEVDRENEKVIVKKAPTLDELALLCKTDRKQKYLTKREYKKIVADAVVEKFRKKGFI